MQQVPLVSTIIPTYNRASLVSEAIDSVLAQTYPQIEVIVIDDGSTDGTLEVLKRYGNRIQVISQPNAGPAAARNRGIDAAQGEMVAFLDSDDLWLPEKLARQVKLLQQLGNVPCCVSSIRMQGKGQQSTSFDVAWLDPAVGEGVWHNPDEILATRFVLFNQGVIIRRPVLKELGGFDERLWLLEDYDLALRLSLYGGWAFVRDPLVIWRDDGETSLSRNAAQDDLRWKLPLVSILEQHLLRLDAGVKHESLRKHLKRELNSLRRQLKAAALRKQGGWGASVAGELIERGERYRKAAFRRSPWFPKMKVETVASWNQKQRETAIPTDENRPHPLAASLHP
jgi:glycosyltransferase involved in cell wall biosynthesis